MKYRFILTAILLMTMLRITAAVPKGSPDFAYPDKVAKDALAGIERAVRQDNGPALVDATIRYALSRTITSDENIPDVLDKITSLRDASHNEAARSMLALVEATIYTTAYNADRWTYSRRDLPLEPRPADYRMWSSRQFQAVVDSLLDLALAPRDVLLATPITEYSQSIELTKHTAEYYPTLYDFVITRAIGLSDDFDNDNQRILPAKALTEGDFSRLAEHSGLNATARRLIALHNAAVDAHKAPSPAGLMAEIRRIEYIRQLIFDPGEDGNVPDETMNQALTALYGRDKDHDWSANALLALDTDVSISSKLDIYDMLKDFAESRPEYYLTPNILDKIDGLTLVSASIHCPGTVGRGGSLNVKVGIHNARTAALHLYRFTADINNSRQNVDDKFAKREVAVVELDLGRRPVIYSDTIPVSLTIPEYGVYTLQVELDGTIPKAYSYDLIRCTDLALFTTDLADNTDAVVVGRDKGAPVTGAKVHIKSGGYNKTADFGSLTTDTNGFAHVTKPEYGNLYPTLGADLYAPSQYYYIGDRADGDTRYDGEIFTDLPLYHPGDSIHGVVVAYSHDTKGRRLLTDSDMIVTLRDVNYEETAQAHVTTDRFGRATFDFAIPEAGLTGDYIVSAEHSGEGGIVSLRIPVSDYKLPTFEVTVDSISGNLQVDGHVTLTGTARYYSGFPVTDAGIAVTLRGVRRGWWRFVRTPAFHDTRLTTDSDGRFTLDIDSATVQMCPVTGADIEATFTVTAPNGETCIANASFATGRPYTISATIPDNCDATRTVTCSITAVNAMGDNTPSVPINIAIMRDTQTVKTINATTPVTGLDLRDLPSGEYDMKVTAADSEQADAPDAVHFVLYRPDDSVCPVESGAIWVPRRVYDVPVDSSSASVIYATPDSDAHILMTVTHKDSIISSRWLTPSAGQHRIKVDLAGTDDVTRVTLSRIKDGVIATEAITLRPADMDAAVKMAIESFRDKVSAGAHESWTIRVTDKEGTGTAAALLMTMYNKALTTLAAQPWDITFRHTEYGQLVVHMPMFSVYDFFRLRGHSYKTAEITAPALYTYGRAFNGIRISNYVRNRLYGAASANFEMVVAEDSAEEEKEEVAADVSMMLTGKSAGIEPPAPSRLDEVVTVAVADTGRAGTEAGQQPDEERQQYRAAEVASAFFAPRLTTDADGTLTYSFDVPDANTAWQLNAVAYTSGLLSTADSRVMTSSKPVMVNPNLPRFVRRGDHLDVRTSVMNNTAGAADITATAELIDPATGTVVDSREFSLSIPANGSSMIVTAIDATTDASALLYRVRATNGAFSDGEQSLLPVLEATQPVIESTTFYIAPDSVTTEVSLPARHTDSQVSLQFCENIAWEAVTALPGLLADDMQTANAAMARIFSAATARCLMRDNPEIAAAISEWSASDRTDSTLVSMLSRNSDLKQMILSATPWVQAAANDTERMNRLVLLFDNKLIDKTIANDTKLLSDLQTSDGGWRWMSGYSNPSLWTTYNVLTGIAELRRLGYLPDSKRMTDMTGKALRYIDREIAETYHDNPKGTYTYYAWLRTQFDDVAPSTAARRVIDTAVQHVIASWNDDDLCGKAIDAMLLKRRGYAATASQVIESLRQYATVSPAKGMYWPRLGSQNPGWGHQVAATSLLLDAFAEVEPKCADIDLIRQWMIINKTTQDWGTGVQTTQIIASILGNGTRWTTPAQGVTISIDGRDIDVPDADSRTGYFVSDITGSLGASPSSLTIVKPGRYPSFGAVIDRYTGVMRQIEAKGCDELQVTKRHLVKRGTEWVESDTAAVGDIVKISLTLTVNQGMDYVAIVDNRAACLEPVEQLPTPVIAEGLYFYRENRDAATNLFIDRLPKGVYILEYQMKVNNAGTFASGLATAQSQYAPAMTAHSSGTTLTITE